MHDNTVSNFGLLDQVAALQWVKDNVEALGGDPQQVTLMGHSTGASCAALLLVSPVSSSEYCAVPRSYTAKQIYSIRPLNIRPENCGGWSANVTAKGMHMLTFLIFEVQQKRRM